MPKTNSKGSDYNPKFDSIRLTKQIRRIFKCMKDGKWRTLSEIAEITGDPQASISAQLRHLRKKEFGSHTVDKHRVGLVTQGLWSYKLTVNTLTKNKLVFT